MRFWLGDARWRLARPICAKHFSGFEFFLLPNLVHVHPSASKEIVGRLNVTDDGIGDIWEVSQWEVVAVIGSKVEVVYTLASLKIVYIVINVVRSRLVIE
jgi:hypothetical protein